MTSFRLLCYALFLTAALTSCKKTANSPILIKKEALSKGLDEIEIFYICEPENDDSTYRLGTDRFAVKYKRHNDAFEFESTTWKGGGAFGEVVSKERCTFSKDSWKHVDNGFLCERTYEKRQKFGRRLMIKDDYYVRFDDREMTLNLTYYGNNGARRTNDYYRCRIDKDKQFK